MGQVYQQGNVLYLKELFNQEQSFNLFKDKLKQGHIFNEVNFQNVGIKIMREALKIFEQLNIQEVTINYDWNQLMLRPRLVCYDKNTWKTLQQLANWNKQWNQLFNECLSLKSVNFNIKISWMDDEFIKKLLEGLTRLPNISSVLIQAKSKTENVQKMLEAFQKGHVFPVFQYKFQKL